MADAADDGSDISGEEFEERVYNPAFLLQCRHAMSDLSPEPSEVAPLKFATLRKEVPAAAETSAAGSPAAAQPAEGRQEVKLAGGSAERPVSEPGWAVAAQPDAHTAAVDKRTPQIAAPSEIANEAATASSSTPANQDRTSDMLRHWAWWRVCVGIDEVVVRKDLRLDSEEVDRIKEGSWLQQCGPVRRITEGKGVGLVRMPIMPTRGWITADATAQSGPLFVEPAAVWKAVHKSGSPYGDILLRATEHLDSREIAILHCGDLVEQIGPHRNLRKMVRMRVSVHSKALAPPEEAQLDGEWNTPRPLKGWVTVDARGAGGPIFFQLRSKGAAS